MNRADLQHLAELRIKEAEALLAASFYDGAYYLAGYAVECALKACIAKETREHDFPDRAVVNKSYTHNLRELIGVAGLQRELDRTVENDGDFAANWNLVKDWSEEARYQRHPESKARDYCAAVIDPEKGVLPWLRERW